MSTSQQLQIFVQAHSKELKKKLKLQNSNFNSQALLKSLSLEGSAYTETNVLYFNTFYMENDAEIFHAHNTWKVAEKGLRWLL